jgi:hypothetical protein
MWMLERFYDEIGVYIADRSQIEPVNITNAANWYYENPQDGWDLRDDFPAVVPPFPIMWMEYRLPKYKNVKGVFKKLPPEIETLGCLSAVATINEGCEQQAIIDDFIGEQLGIKESLNYSTDIQKARLDGNRNALAAGRQAKWAVFWRFFIATHQRVSQPLMRAAYVEANGQMITENIDLLTIRPFTPDMTEYLAPYMDPFHFANSLMHAKNVSLEADPLPAAVTKRRAKEGKPAITFKVLQINPIRRQAAKEHSAGETGAKRAMHIVRGHFKDYRESAGLFGKLKGLYWWDMHVAGDKANGQVIKDYTIAKVSK